jgi:HEAT repeats
MTYFDRGLTAFVLLGLLGAGACKRSSAPAPAAEPIAKPVPVLGEISVQDLTPEPMRPDGAKLPVDRLAGETRSNLVSAGIFAAGKGDAGAAPVAARVRIEASCEDVVAGDKAAARAVVRLRIDTRPSEVSAPHWNEDVQAGAETLYNPTEKADKAALFQKLVSRTVSDLLAGYVARQRLWLGDGAAARATIKADAGELRLEALRVVGERKLSGAVPDLLALLEDPDEAVRDAALGALVELRERKAVSVLASQKSMRDQREMRKILDAIATLGGEEAAEYLSFVADGHDDPEIRSIAAEAKARLQRRAAAEPKR